MFWDRSSGPIPAFSIQIHDLKQNSGIKNTQTAPNFWAVSDGGKNPQEILTIRSHVLGPIKRPLTASNQPKHGKTLKNGNKTQVGRKSYFLELSKTRKPRVHALSSPRRTFPLLAPKPANGRIARDLREKHPLSLKLSQKWWLLEEFWFFTFLSCFLRKKMSTIYSFVI